MKNTKKMAALVLALAAFSLVKAEPMTWTAGGYTSSSQNVPPTADNGTIVSTITPTSLSATMTTNPANDVLGALYLDGNFSSGPLVSQTLKLQYDITVNNQPASATTQPKNLDRSLIGGSSSAGTAGILLGMNIAATVPGPPSPWAFRFALAATSAADGVFAMRSIDNNTLFAFGEYEVGTTYNLMLDANYSTGLLDAYINGSLALSGYQFSTGGPGISTSEVFIHLNGQSNVANSVTIGNLSASSSVPDAGSSVALLGGALATMGLIRWRMRR